jgi:hypothetical protein
MSEIETAAEQRDQIDEEAARMFRAWSRVGVRGQLVRSEDSLTHWTVNATIKVLFPDLTRRLAEVTAERDAALRGQADALREAMVNTVAADRELLRDTEYKRLHKEKMDEFFRRVEAEAALSRRDEALRAARNGLIAARPALHPAVNFMGRLKAVDDAIAKIDALTQPQGDADGKPR